MKSMLAALALVGGLARFAAASEQTDFDAALADAATEPARAVKELVALADRAPTGEFADDALLEAAELTDERLADPVAALALYRRILSDYPTSRVARRAAVRERVLAAGLGPDGAHAVALAAYLAATRSATLAAQDQALTQVAELLRTDPGFPLADQARLWLGQAHLDRGHRGEAARWFAEAVRSREVAVARHAALGLAATAEAGGDHAAATARYQALIADDDPTVRIVAVEGLAAVDLAVRRDHLRLVAWLTLALMLALWGLIARVGLGSIAAVGRALARPPGEALYLLPIAAIFAIVGQTADPRAGRALCWLGLGALAITWASGAIHRDLRARGRAGWARGLAHAAGSALAVLALVYLCLAHAGLLDLVAATLRGGPDD